MATVITIINYDCIVITIENYDPKIFIVQATDHFLPLLTQKKLHSDRL